MTNPETSSNPDIPVSFCCNLNIILFYIFFLSDLPTLDRQERNPFSLFLGLYTPTGFCWLGCKQIWRQTVFDSHFWCPIFIRYLNFPARQKFLTYFLGLLTPYTAANFGPKGMMLNRAIQGFCQGFIYPSLTQLLSQWVPAEERSRLGTIVYAGL